MNAADNSWILASSALVLLMTLPGLALFYGGLVRAKNVLSVFIQCFAIAAIVSILWVLGAYSLAFADGGALQPFLGSLDDAGLLSIRPDSVKGSVPAATFVMFQMTFAVITPALIVGAYAERVRFAFVLWFSALWLLLVYVPVAHWVWGGGWLATLGVMDFAGGIVVHVNAGVAALVCALFIGRRRGFPQVPMPPHSLPLVATGAGLLWIGWFGFNGGSALASNGTAAFAILATHVAACTGAAAWAFWEWLRYGKVSVLGALTGVVAGLGTITAAAGFVSPLGGLAIGIGGGSICFFATQWLKAVLKIDDSLDVSPVHGVGGVVGTLLVAPFASISLGGVGYIVQHDFWSQLAVQALGVLATSVWCGLVTLTLLYVLQSTIGIRVAEDQESEGLDLAEHGERSYIN